METILRIDGMTCGGCAAGVEAALRRVVGVDEVDVALSAGEAKVRGHAAPEALVTAVEDAGFQVLSLQSDDRP